MKRLTVSNYTSMEGRKMGDGGNEFVYKAVVAPDEISQCRVGFVEVDPGNYAFGYHYHEMDEEVFYIISGTGVVRTSKGDITLKAGDAITFPTGEDGAHVIRNDSQTEKLVYIDFDTNNSPEIVHFPDMGKVMVNGPYSSGMYDVVKE